MYNFASGVNFIEIIFAGIFWADRGKKQRKMFMPQGNNLTKRNI